MVNRPGDFDITTPRGSSSPRSGDDELRKIKDYTQNAYNDLTQPSGAAVIHTDLYGVEITADVGFTGNLIGNTAGVHVGPSTGNHTGDVLASDNEVIIDHTAKSITAEGGLTGELSGNASTASTLLNARNIAISGDATGSASFNGGANISIDVNVNGVQPDSVELGADTTGAYVATVAGTTDEILVSGSGSESAGITLSLPGTINANTTGNAASSTVWESPRTLSITGDVSGSVSGIDGSGNISVSTTVQPNSVALGTDTTGAYVAGVSGTTNEIVVSGSGGESAGVVLSLPTTINANTTGSSSSAGQVDTITNATNSEHYLTFVNSDNPSAASENILTNSGVSVNPSTGTISAELDGNASTASQLETARTITFQRATGADAGITGSGSFDGSGNITIDTTLLGSVTEGSVTSAGRWTTPRNFTLTGDTTSTAVSVDGSADVSITTNISNNVVGAAELNVSGNGAAGQVLRSDGDGSFTWITPTSATYTAGTGLDLTGTTFSVEPNGITADQLAVAGDGLATQFLRSDADGSFSWAIPTDTNTTYTGGTSITLTGTSFGIADGAITGTQLGTNSVSLAKMADNSVGSAEIIDNNVGASELNVSGNGTTTQFLRADGDGSFTWATPTDTNTTYSAGAGLDLGSNTFSVSDNGISATQLNVSGSGAVSQYLRSDADGSFTWATPTNTTYNVFTGQTANGGYLLPEKDAGGTTTKYMREDGSWSIPPDTNTTYNFSSSFTNSGNNIFIADNGVNSSAIQDGSITAGKIFDGSVITSKINNGAVTASKIGTNAVGATQLNVDGNGLAGQVLSSDGDGSMSWASAGGTPIESRIIGFGGDWYGITSAATDFNLVPMLNTLGGAGTYSFLLVGAGGGGRSASSSGTLGGGGAGGAATFVLDWDGVSALTATVPTGGSGRPQGSNGGNGGNGGTAQFKIGGVIYAQATGGTGGNLTSAPGGVGSFPQGTGLFPDYAEIRQGGRGGQGSRPFQGTAVGGGGGGVDAFGIAAANGRTSDGTDTGLTNGGNCFGTPLGWLGDGTVVSGNNVLSTTSPGNLITRGQLFTGGQGGTTASFSSPGLGGGAGGTVHGGSGDAPGSSGGGGGALFVSKL